MANYRRYWDLEERERAALTRAEVEEFLVVELMERGALRPKQPVPEPIVETSIPTTQVFVVKKDAYHELDIAFPSAGAAQAFLDLAPMLIDRDYNAGNALFLKSFAEGGEIISKQVMTEAEALAHRSVLRENEARKQRNAAAQTTYEKAVKTLDAETRDVWEDYRRCQDLVVKHHRVIEVWAQYVATTRGDEEIAWRFLMKAFTADDARDAFKFNQMILPAPAAKETPAEVAPMPLVEEAGAGEPF
jgi:hypothetical protein